MSETLDLLTESLSGCQYGEAKPIGGIIWSSPTVIHDISDATAIDAVYLRLWNTTATEVEVFLILNPNDSDTQADVDASTVPVLVPGNTSVWVLQGDRFRKHGSTVNTEAIAAYVASADANSVLFTGYFNRQIQSEATP